MSAAVLPAPAFDHVVINTRDRLEAAAAAYRRLGFSLTPLGRHSLGSINHLAVFATDYLELVGIESASPGPVRGGILEFPAGLNGLVFATEDAAAVHRRLAVAGIGVEPPAALSRPVTLAEGVKEARFSVTRLPAAAVPYGRVYFCQHETRALVWRDEWRVHANGVVAIQRAVICAAEPAATVALYVQLFGAAAVRRIEGGFSVVAGLACLDILAPAALAAAFGDAAPESGGRQTYPAAVGFRTLSLDACRAALRQGGISDIAERDGRIIVKAADGFGAAIEFLA